MRIFRSRKSLIAAAAVGGVLALAPGFSRLVAQQSTPNSLNFILHNWDLYGSRYVPVDQISRSNVASLTPRWLFQYGMIDGVSNQTTPIVVDGVMFLTDPRGGVYAVNAVDGHLIWSFDVTPYLGGLREVGYVFRNRGPAYENGVVYTAAGSFLFALDAKTGKLVESFGNKGQAFVILDIIKERAAARANTEGGPETAIEIGYWFTAAPQIHNGVIYTGTTRSESMIPGGYVMAVDAKTGKVIWHFNTIPQDEKDQGWEIAGPTWVGGIRNGGGIWETPSIDTELNSLYVAVANPFGDSKKRAGINLFTDSIISLDLNTGKLNWYYQQVHHDVWDYDSGSPPILFDMQVNGKPVKAVAEANKNGYLYILDRVTGQPVHPIKEMPVPTTPAAAGEQPWPTQPIPHTAAGKPMEPVCPVFPEEIPQAHIDANKLKLVPIFTPMNPGQVIAPGMGGGTNYGPLAYSPRTGLLYVNAIDQPSNSGRGPRMFLSAYDPTTGELIWRKIYEGFGQAGPIVTSSDLLFVGTGSNIAGYFYALDAKTGEELWKYNTGAGVFSSPSTYVVNGQQFIAVGSGGGDRGRRGGDLILSFALPQRN